MSPGKAFDVVINAAIERWSENTNDAVLREALTQVLEQISDTLPRRALEVKWRAAPTMENSYRDATFKKHDDWRPARRRS
jgi:hypothetical protein